MSKYYGLHDNNGVRPSRKRRPWITALKVIAWCVGILVVLAGIAVWIISYYVSSDYIARLIEKESDKYLKAEVKIGSLEYKLFSTYPWLSFEVDSVTVISRSLDGVSPEVMAQLPENPDFLASLEKIRGKVNIHDLLHGKINLKDIELERPDVNIVIVNDSLTNFNIAKSLPSVKKAPEIDISKIELIAPVDFSFFSLPLELQSKINLEEFGLWKEEEKSYRLSFKGLIEGHYQEYELPAQVPVALNTGIKIDFPSLSVALNDLIFSVAGLAVEAKGDVSANGKIIDFNSVDLKIKVEDLFTLLKYLPENLIETFQIPSGLNGCLPLDFTFNLLSPYQIDTSQPMTMPSLEDMPKVMAMVKVEEASLSYFPPKGKEVEADDIYIEAVMNFDPQNRDETNLELRELRLKGEGISVAGSLYVNELLSEVQDLEGDFHFQSPLMESLSYLMPGLGIKVKGLLKGEVEFSGNAVNLGKDGFKDIRISGDIDSRSLAVATGQKGEVKIKNLKGGYQASLPCYPFNNNYTGTRLDFDLSADTLSSRESNATILFSGLNVRMDAVDTVSGNADPSGELTLSASGFKFAQGGNSFNGTGIEVNATGSLNSGGNTGNYKTVSLPTTPNDRLIASRVDHTPLMLEYDGGGMLQTIMTLVSLNADVKLGKGEFKSTAYLYPVAVNGLSLSTDLNRFALTSDRIGLANTSFQLTALAEGIQPFMTSYAATPLKLSADIDFNDVDINQLSWGYYGALIAKGENPDSVFYIPPLLPLTAADSVCVVIPGNIDAIVRLRSKRAEYMDYTFAPLSTDIIVKDGAATLSRLTVGAPYCTAVVDWTYSTSSLDNIFMDLKADVLNFRFDPFYKVFPMLLTRAPELQNLTGTINAEIDCRFLMFPNMFINPASLKGNFRIKASDMEFAREGKIERITHLMLIEGNEPIHIENMNITGGYHDNLLQINPFKIRFSDYQLGMAGINNTSGDMYYHIALEKSPFHLPFGVSLVGKFGHPEVRLGGTRIDDFKSEMVSTNQNSKIDVDIMAWLKHGWQIFIQEAAKAQQKKESDKNGD